MPEQIYYPSADDFFRDLLLQIQSAQSQILLEYYIFEKSSRVGQDIWQKLLEAAHRGVQVYVLVDGVGSRDWMWDSLELDPKLPLCVQIFNPVPWPISWALYKKKMQWKALTQFWSEVNRRNHKKVVVIDQKIVFIGSMNIHNEASQWVEAGVKWVDAGTASVLGRFFFFNRRKSFELFKGQMSLDFPIEHPRTVMVPKHLLLQQTRRQRKIFREQHKAAFKAAQQHIVLVTPYFVPSLWLVRAIARATKRGVKVSLLLSKTLDYRFLNWVIDKYLYTFLEMGVEIYKSRPMVHAKVVKADNWIHLGSSNLNQRSLRLDLEANVLISDKESASQVEQSLNNWIQNSERVTVENLNQRPWQEKLLGFLLQMFRTYL